MEHSDLLQVPPVPSADPIISCENLVKIYKTKDSEVLALQGLELTIARGELMAIIGNSGSGKSTLLNMIGGLDRPSAGTLTVDRKDLFKLTEPQLVEYKRHTVGFVWQNNARNLLPYLTAAQNVQLPMLLCKTLKKEQRANELLELVGLAGKENRKLAELSGGEQQRVAIAIALSNSPQILLADEPTGSVDAKTGEHILDIFRDLNRSLGLTVVIVTHDQLLAKKVNRVVAIRDGKTSSERILKQSYRDQIHSIHLFDDTQDEFAVLDRAGRLQIPRELLNEIGVTGNRVRLTSANGKILIEPDGRTEEKN